MYNVAENNVYHSVYCIRRQLERLLNVASIEQSNEETKNKKNKKEERRKKNKRQDDNIMVCTIP